MSCQKEYNFEQKKTELSTLGDELYKVWVKDAARSTENAEPKVQMLKANQASFINAVNVLVPPDQLKAVDQFLRNILALVDDGIVPALTRKLILILNQAANNPALLDALATPTGPDTDTYFSHQQKPNVLGYASRFPDLPRLLELGGRIVGDNDGFDDQGLRTFEEPAAISDLLRILTHALMDDLSSDSRSLAALMRDMLLIENNQYKDATDAVWAVRFDDRGYPLAATVQGKVQSPFVDQNNDGLADIDENGNFIYGTGASGLLRPFAKDTDFNEPITRDSLGRAVTGGPNSFAFQYLDLQSTGFGFLTRRMKFLSAEDAIFNALQAFQVVLGNKRVYTDEIGGYEGYDENNPLSDASYAALTILDTPALPNALEGAALLTERHTVKIAKLFASISKLADIIDKYPNAKMDEGQTLLYDLIPHMAELTESPQLWADVLAAFRDPINRKTGEAFATMLKYKDGDSIPVKNGPYDTCFHRCKAAHQLGSIERYACIRACPMAEIFDELADLNVVETEESRSSFQRFVNLIRDTNGASYSMAVLKAEKDGSPLIDVSAFPPLVRFDDEGGAFVRAVGGNLDLAEHVPPEVFQGAFGDLLDLLGVQRNDVASLLAVLSPLFGATMSQLATPDELTRFLSQKDIKFETTTRGGTHILMDMSDPVCNDKFRLSNHMIYTLFQAEAAGVVDTLHPLAKALSTHNKEHIIGGVMDVLYNHYSSRNDLYKTQNGANSPMKGSNFRSYEETMLDIFSNSEIFDALNELALAVNEVEKSTSIPIGESLRLLTRRALQKDGFKNLRNEDYVVITGGQTINNATRMHHILSALDTAAKRLDNAPEKKEKFNQSIRSMLSVFLDAEFIGEQAVFKEKGSPALLIDTSKFLSKEARTKQQAGQLSSWINGTLIPNVRDLWKSRLMASSVDLAGNILSNEGDKKTIDELMEYQLGSNEGQGQTLVAMYPILVKSVNTSYWKEIAHFLATVINPDQRWESEPYKEVPIVSLAAQLLGKTLEADPENTGIFMISRGLDRVGEKSPFSILIDIIARYFSPNPLDETFAKGSDSGHFVRQISNYLQDDIHGLERLYEVVDQRSR